MTSDKREVAEIADHKTTGIERRRGCALHVTASVAEASAMKTNDDTETYT